MIRRYRALGARPEDGLYQVRDDRRRRAAELKRAAEAGKLDRDTVAVIRRQQRTILWHNTARLNRGERNSTLLNAVACVAGKNSRCEQKRHSEEVLTAKKGLEDMSFDELIADLIKLDPKILHAALEEYLIDTGLTNADLSITVAFLL
jgi:hypothetical protein